MSRPLRFCMVTTFYPPCSFGGDAVFVQNLSEILVAEGHHVEVIHCVDSYRLLGGRRSLESESGEVGSGPVVHHLRSPFGWLSPLATQQTGRPFFKRRRIESIFSQGFDVIHFHNLSLVGGPGLLSSGSAIKLYTMHECWLVCPTHVLQQYGREPCKTQNCVRCILAHRRPPQLWRHTGLLDRALRSVDAFIAPSRYSADVHRKRFPGMPIATIPNFAPPADEAPGVEPEERMGRPYFLFVGRLEHLKGLHTVIPVFKTMSGVRLLVAGTGAEESKLRKMASGAENIKFLGFQSGAALQDLYRRACAVIVPSLVQEIFPLVILEALRVGTPVVVRGLGGMPEIVAESGGGFSYTDDDEFLQLLGRILADPADCERRGASGREAFERLWTPQAHLERYLELVRSIGARSQADEPVESWVSR